MKLVKVSLKWKRKFRLHLINIEFDPCPAQEYLHFFSLPFFVTVINKTKQNKTEKLVV